jgi:DNA-binding GntR family transcriptional regulator
MNSIWQPSDDNAQEKAYQYIKEAIIGFQLKPDQRLVAAELATTLNASRTPIREALSRLEQEGFVARAGGWGYVVRGMQLSDLLDMFRVREALEVAAIAEAMPNLDPGSIVQLQKILDKAAKSRALPGKFVALNRSFHNQIVSKTRNELLRYMLSFISDRVQMTGVMTVQFHQQRMSEILQENQAILHALAAGDVAVAQAAVREHIQKGRQRAVEILERNGGRFVVAPAV